MTVTVTSTNGEERRYEMAEAFVADNCLHVWRTNGCEGQYKVREFQLASFPLVNVQMWRG